VGWASYKSLLGREWGVWEDNIEVDLRESSFGNAKDAELAQTILVMNVKVHRIIC
jgi:hypothetical protein